MALQELGVLRAGQLEADRRLTLDYGVRFYYLTPQWDTTLQASNFLPDQFNASAAAKLYTPVCIGADSVRGLRPARHGSGAHRPGRPADAGQHASRSASSAG